MMFRVILLSLALLTTPSFAKEKTIKIRLLNWWEYLDVRVQEKLKANGFEIELTPYKSNEIAMSRLVLTNTKHDVVIISNVIINSALQANALDTGVLKPDNKDIYSFIPKVPGCVPYLWSTTVFVTDPRVKKASPKTFEELLALRQAGFEVAIVDDSFEVSARMMADNNLMFDRVNRVNASPFSRVQKALETPAFQNLEAIRSVKVLTSVGEHLQKPNAAMYGWHGEVAGNLKKAPWLEFSLPKQFPIVGADYVCLARDRAHKDISEKDLRRFVSLLTDRESIGWNVQTSQYFSPFEGDQRNLQPKVQLLQKNLISLMKSSKPVWLSSPSPEDHKALNKWWRKARYGEN